MLQNVPYTASAIAFHSSQRSLRLCGEPSGKARKKRGCTVEGRESVQPGGGGNEDCGDQATCLAFPGVDFLAVLGTTSSTRLAPSPSTTPPATSRRHWTTPLSPDATATADRTAGSGRAAKASTARPKGAPQPMTANQTDPATGTRSTRPEAPAKAASDAPTGNPSQPRPTLPEGMGELDRRAIDTARVLAMDAVQKAGNGHPGTAMSVGPTAYLLFQKWLRHDPGDPDWVGRVVGRPVRAHAPLRRPRARHGRHHERHRAAQRDPHGPASPRPPILPGCRENEAMCSAERGGRSGAPGPFGAI